MKKYLFFFLFFMSIASAHAQVNRIRPWYPNSAMPNFISYGIGCQHSGFGKDFRHLSNFSPLIHAEIGTYIKPYFAINLGGKGLYYKYPSHKSKHLYAFLYANFILDVVKLFEDNDRNKFTVQIFAGGGVLFNKYPFLFYKEHQKMTFPSGRLIVAGNLGITGLYNVAKNFQLGIEVSSIVAWGLYQTNLDAVPGTSLKAVYLF